jgi:AcrR family transcriptional regulator
MARAGVDPEVIVTAAATLADSEGLDAVNLKRVAESLGVRPPSLYAHVDGIDDIVLRLGRRGLHEQAAALSRAVEGRSGVDALVALAGAYRAYAREHPGAYAASQRSQELEHDEAAQVAAEAVVRIVLAVLRDYELDGDDAIHAVRLVRVALHGFISLEAVGGFAMEQSVDDTYERLVTLLDLGLRSGLSPRATPVLRDNS